MNCWNYYVLTAIPGQCYSINCNALYEYQSMFNIHAFPWGEDLTLIFWFDKASKLEGSLATTFMILAKSVSIRFRILSQLWQSVQHQKFSRSSTWKIITIKMCVVWLKFFFFFDLIFLVLVIPLSFKENFIFVFRYKLKFLNGQSSNLCSVTCWHKCVFASESFETTLNLHRPLQL